MLWVIGITVLATSLMLVLFQNLKTPEKVLECKVAHRWVISDPQFRREMSAFQVIYAHKVKSDLYCMEIVTVL